MGHYIMEHDEEYYKQKYIKYKMKYVEKLDKKNNKNKKNVEGGSLKNKKKKRIRKKKNKAISKTVLDKTVENKYTVPKKLAQEINFNNMDDIRLLMLYPELKKSSFWEKSK